MYICLHFALSVAKMADCIQYRYFVFDSQVLIKIFNLSRQIFKCIKFASVYLTFEKISFVIGPCFKNKENKMSVEESRYLDGLTSFQPPENFYEHYRTILGDHRTILEIMAFLASQRMLIKVIYMLSGRG